MLRCDALQALLTHEKTITYRYFLEQTAILAHALREKGITHEMPVAILQPPSIEQVISQIGILMAGGSGVPLDPDMPDMRLNDMLDDLQVHWTLSLTPQPGRCLHTTLLLFSDYANGNKSDSKDVRISPYHRTHVLFTSGTTGKSKAVEIEARNILRLVVDTHYVVFDMNDRTACIANPTFDASLFENLGHASQWCNACHHSQRDSAEYPPVSNAIDSTANYPDVYHQDII